MKERLWTIVKINCDSCGSYTWARLRDINYNKFAPVRCRFCRKSLGDMECKFIARTRATTESEAIQKIK